MSPTRPSSLSTIKNACITSLWVEGKQYIGTHHGTFHCDEALAVALLKCLPQYAQHDVIRTRDETLLQQCDVVVDVGGMYDVDKKRFDHHQQGFTQTFPTFQTKLSSAGLVYYHFGKDILQEISPVPLNEASLDVLYPKFYKGFIEHIDGIDNGVEISDGPLKYQITTSLSARVSSLNPSWNQDQSKEAANAAFLEAMCLTGSEFLSHVERCVTTWWPARSIVEATLSERYNIHDSGQILKLSEYCPWKSHLYALEKAADCEGAIKFVLYEDTTGQMWRIQAVNVQEGQFALRCGLPTEWRGLRDASLSQVANIVGCTFCHANGFIGGNKTYEGALQMAMAALEDMQMTKRPKLE